MPLFDRFILMLEVQRLRGSVSRFLLRLLATGKVVYLPVAAN